jgi:hypothetical protein
VLLRETFQEDDAIVNEYLSDVLEPIRVNFKRINSIPSWTSIVTKDIWISTEGGEAKYYYLAETLEKVVERHYGETFQVSREYYLLDGQLSFVFQRIYRYNSPIYYDSTFLYRNSTEPEDLNDIEFFDFDRSEIIEERSYFERGILIHQINNQDCGSPFSEDYLVEEQERLTELFDNLAVLRIVE